MAGVIKAYFQRVSAQVAEFAAYFARKDGSNISDPTTFRTYLGAGTGNGTVTSVSATVPSGFAVSGSPVTGSGTLAVSYATGQTAAKVLATPAASTGALSLVSLGKQHQVSTTVYTDQANSFTGLQTITVAANPSLALRSGASGSFVWMQIGRTATEMSLGVAGAADQFVTGTVAGDGIIKQDSGNLFISRNNGNTLSITSTGFGFNTAAPGVFIDITKGDTTGLRLLSGGASKYALFELGHTGAEFSFGLPGAADQFFTGATLGDMCLKLNSSSQVFRLGVGGATSQLQIANAAINSNVTITLSGLSSTSTLRTQGSFVPSWVVSTDASRTARVVWNVYDTAAREVMRGEASGSAPMIGFLGSAATAKVAITGSRGSNAALASLLTELAAKGLITDSTTA